MNWYSIRPWLGTLARLGLGAVWLWAGISKLGDPRLFVQAVRAYDMTPEWLSKAVGYGLPVLEVCLGVLLVAGVAVRLAAAASGVLLLVFLAGILQAAARGLKLDCGCFGGGGGQTAAPTHYTLDVLRDLGLLVLAVFLVLWSFTRISIEEFLARHDYVEPPSAKRLRDPNAVRKYNAAVEQKHKAAVQRALYVNSSLAIVVVLVSFIGIGVQSGRAKISGATTATNASVSNGVVFGKKAAATVDIFEDFLCPNCGTFERAVGATLEKDVRANLAQARYHTMSFLDRNTTDNYSTRAANAALCASDISVDAFVKYHAVLYQSDVQPKEGSNGRTDAQFASYAQRAGFTPDQVTTFTACVESHQHKALVQAITDNCSKRGVTATPTVWVNGKSITPTLAALEKAIADADAKGPPPSPSVTPTPTPTPSTSAKTTPKATPKPTPSTSR